MRVVTIVSLAASAVLGLGALFVAKVALPNASAAKLPMAQGEAPGSPMVVAKHEIKYGDKLDAGMLTVVKVPASAIPQGAFTTVQQALGADPSGPPVAITPIAEREPLLPTKLSGPGARRSVAAEIQDGKRAYALKVNDATGVGGHALPGDRVDVVLMRDLTPNGPTRNYISYVVVQNARVLGLDLNADPTTDKPANPNTYTIEVSVEEAQKLSVATTLGTLSLALRRTGGVEVADARPLRTADFLTGGGGGGAPSRGGGPVRPRSAILIIEGQAVKHSRTKAASVAPPAVAGAAGAANTQPASAGLGLGLIG
jgi:pilus assembly protein CpaB